MSRFKKFFNEITNDGRIFSFEDVVKIPREEDEFYRKALDFQYGKIGFPREKELQDSVNVSKVEPFTYDDGSVTRAGFRSNDGAQFVDYSKPFMTTPSMEKSRIDKKVDDMFGGSSTEFSAPQQPKQKQIEPFKSGIVQNENLGVKTSPDINNNGIQVSGKSDVIAKNNPWEPSPTLLKTGIEEVNYLDTPLYDEQNSVKYDPAQVLQDSQASTVTGYEYQGSPISAEQAKEIERIQNEFATERAQIEKDRILGHAQDWGGFALQVAGAPVMGPTSITRAIAAKLAPKVGQKIANEMAAGFLQGTLGGSLGGLGDAMIKDKDAQGIAESTVGGAVAGGVGGALAGYGASKFQKFLDKLGWRNKAQVAEGVGENLDNYSGALSEQATEKPRYTIWFEDSPGDFNKNSKSRGLKSDDYYDKHVKDGKSINFNSMLEEGSPLPISREEEEILRHEINTYYARNPEFKKEKFKISDGRYKYTVENYGFDKYKIVDMEIIE